MVTNVIRKNLWCGWQSTQLPSTLVYLAFERGSGIVEELPTLYITLISAFVREYKRTDFDENRGRHHQSQY